MIDHMRISNVRSLSLLIQDFSRRAILHRDRNSKVGRSGRDVGIAVFLGEAAEVVHGPPVPDLEVPDRVRARDQVRADRLVGAGLVVARDIGALAGGVEARRVGPGAARNHEAVCAAAGRAADFEVRHLPGSFACCPVEVVDATSICERSDGGGEAGEEKIQAHVVCCCFFFFF